LIYQQTTQGYWERPEGLAIFIKNATVESLLQHEMIQTELAGLIKDQAEIQKVWLTLIALWIL
jgi:hypothetical protein